MKPKNEKDDDKYVGSKLLFIYHNLGSSWNTRERGGGGAS